MATELHAVLRDTSLVNGHRDVQVGIYQDNDISSGYIGPLMVTFKGSYGWYQTSCLTQSTVPRELSYCIPWELWYY